MTDPPIAPVTGRAVLNDPTLNKGTAFTTAERVELGIDGLIPPRVETMAEQCARLRDKYDRLHDDLERHVFLRAVHDANQILFYGFVAEHLTEMLPILYTPTVGLACEEFSHIYRRPIGLFLSYSDRDRMAAQFDAFDGEVDVVVVTDGERILGLGDQGVGGMGIPIGKLSLYTAAGGIDPSRTLPIFLDVGTNSRALLDDPLYLGSRHERITGEDYDEFVEQFVHGLFDRFPNVLLQWEDFAGHHATSLLHRYRDRVLSFNDDIQGTAAVALAAVHAAVNFTAQEVADQRICIVGAGSAGPGIAAMLSDGEPSHRPSSGHRSCRRRCRRHSRRGGDGLQARGVVVGAGLWRHRAASGSEPIVTDAPGADMPTNEHIAPERSNTSSVKCVEVVTDPLLM